jgi:hypothetical protein
MSLTPFDELVQKTEGELTERRVAELERALATSPSLQAEQARVDQLVGALSRSAPGLEEVDLREGLWELPGPVPAAPARRWGLVAGPLVALAAAAVVLLVPRDEFRAKGGQGSPAGLEVFTLRAENAVPLGATMRAGDALGFAWRNLPGSPYRALMIYATDSKGTVFWFYPAWTDTKRPPDSIPIGTSAEQVELREAVQHSLTTGPLTVHALFTRSALSVLDVEAGRVPTQDVVHVTREVQVVP